MTQCPLKCFKKHRVFYKRPDQRGVLSPCCLPPSSAHQSTEQSAYASKQVTNAERLSKKIDVLAVHNPVHDDVVGVA